MPQVNGNHYRSFGQGYAAEKSKMGKEPEEKQGEASDKARGSVVHVKHHGKGKFSVKHEGGSMTQHESPEDMHAHLDEHFHTGAQGSEEGMEDGDEGGEHALKSILGGY